MLDVEAYYYDRYQKKQVAKYDPKIPEYIRAINSKFNIRDNVDNYITDEMTDLIGNHLESVLLGYDSGGKITGIKPTRKEIVAYIDSSFGYRTRQQIDELICSRFGESAMISTNNNVFLISCLARLKDWFNGDKWLMNEIDNYCRNYNIPVDSIILDIKGINVPDGPDPAVRLMFLKRVGKRDIEKREYHKSDLNNITEDSITQGFYKNREKITRKQLSSLAVGNNITHKSLGEAEIVSIEAKEKGNIVTLIFKNGTQKKFLEELLVKDLV